MSLQIMIADDHPLFRKALRETMAELANDIGFIECDSVGTLLAALEPHPDPDLLLLDLHMPHASGFAALAHLRGSRPTLPVVVVSALDDDETIQNALAYGAQGFISKSADASSMAADVARVLDGDVCTPHSYRARTSARLDPDDLQIAQRMGHLTAQQFRVLGMLCAGLPNKQIAHALEVSEATVKAHMTAILRKLGVANRTHAVLVAGKLAATRQTAVAPDNDL
jgi:DNA-binding NarL/FixJ family response regulator